MHVLRKGKKDDWRWIGKCGSCGAIVEAYTREIRSHIRTAEAVAVVSCPECIDRMIFYRAETLVGHQILAEVASPHKDDG